MGQTGLIRQIGRFTVHCTRGALLMYAVLLLAFVAGPPVVSDTAHGDRLRDTYFRLQAKKIADQAAADLRSRADWDKQRPEMRRRFLDMMGLWPIPPKTNLRPKVTGTFTTPHYRVEKLHFQSVPGLYVTANLYLPLKVEKPAPAILYVCGHGPSIVGGVSYGNKVTYQHHGAWFAENGYVCLIVDTLQLGEAQGLHHGTSRFNMWWWQALGYTPAGIELWNGIRAIDYLETRNEVDRNRIGVTGRSGGGATSWWVMAADRRVKVGVPVAGVADLLAHVSEGYPGRLADGVVAGHCDCMYLNNTYRWDYTQVMALCAPRPLLLGNSDADSIFPVPGYRRMAAPVKKLYEQYGAVERFGLLETKGPHKDTPELRQGAFAWMNRWLKNERGEVIQPARPRHAPKELKVFDRLPADAINDVAHERFRRPAKLELPEAREVAKEWWKGKSAELMAGLREKVFRSWPEKAPPLGVSASDTSAHGVRLEAIDFLSEEGVPLRAWRLQAEKAAVKELIISVCDEDDWQRWLEALGPDFRRPLHGGGNPPPVPYPVWQKDRLEQLRRSMAAYGWSYAIVAPRGVGPTRWSEQHRFDGKPNGHQLLRRFALLGQTLDGQRVWDVRRAVAALGVGVDGKVKRTLQASGTMAGVALYAALFEPGVAKLELSRPPATHRVGPTFLNVLTLLDMPQAVALALPREVVLEVAGDEEAAAWNWTMTLQKRLGEEKIKVRVRKE